jgi:hypothetical protein
MTWKPVKISDLDPESQRQAQENMDFWIGKGLRLTPIENTKTTHQSKKYPEPETSDWYKQGKECPF